ncbi:MAG: acyl-CoA N-acyltransferase [Benjaminiella poitrasii]|nr:MAG: acyl-CoA N-acyltransferase [Benjaminiella poitrasii]
MVQPSICVRKVSPSETQYTEESVKVVNAAYRSDGGWTSEKDCVNGARVTTEMMETMIRTNGSPNTLLLAFDEGQVVGTIQIQPYEEYPGEAEIGLFSVSPNHQSRGIGGRLMQTALAEMKTMGFKYAVLHVLENRSDVLTWYNKLGFVETGERIPFVWPESLKIKDLKFIVLKKALDQN